MSSSMKLIGNREKGILFIMSAPAGTGKTTLASKLTREFPEHIVRSISTTTRAPRDGEINGVDYFFIPEPEFLEKRERGEFLESAKVFSNYYGTSKEAVVTLLSEGKHVLLVIDTQGAESIRDKMEAVTIFIKPPSEETLKKRLHQRGTDSEADVTTRLSWATRELEQASKFDYIIVNDELELAYQVLRSIIVAEEHKVL